MIVEKVFSEQDTDERLYSVLMNEEEITLFSDFEKFYSEDENKKKKRKKRTPLSEIKSHKGLKRALLTAPFTGFGSLTGGYLSKDKADDLDEQGATDAQILKAAKRHGGKVGAITGALSAGLAGSSGGLKGSLGSAALGSAFGYIGGSEAARVNTTHRLKKRSES